jgi:hypothetical protein
VFSEAHVCMKQELKVVITLKGWTADTSEGRRVCNGHGARGGLLSNKQLCHSYVCFRKISFHLIMNSNDTATLFLPNLWLISF